MDKIRYDFDEAIRQINQIRKLHEKVEQGINDVKQVQAKASQEDGKIMRLLVDALDEQIRRGNRLCERLTQLESALRKNLQCFEDVEMELAKGIGSIAEMQANPLHTPKLTIPNHQCMVADLRFSNVIYPDFLRQAAERYFASNW